MSFGSWSQIPEPSFSTEAQDKQKHIPPNFLGSPGPWFCQLSTKMPPGKEAGDTSPRVTERPASPRLDRPIFSSYMESEGGPGRTSGPVLDSGFHTPSLSCCFH